MMGLNILPRLETGSKRPHHPQQSSDQASTACQIHHTGNDGVQGQVHGAAGHLCCQDFESQIGLSSTNTGIWSLISPTYLRKGSSDNNVGIV